jgi:hypothetical protein
VEYRIEVEEQLQPACAPGVGLSVNQNARVDVKLQMERCAG